MKTLRLCGLLTAILLLTSASIEAGPIKDQVVGPYVAVQTADGHGTGAGTVIEWNGEVLVLTAEHVIWNCVTKKGDRVRVRPATLVFRKAEGPPRKILADLVYSSHSDEGVDLALLRPREKLLVKPAVLGCDKPELEEGEDVLYIGTPGGVYACLEKTIVSVVGHKQYGHAYTGINGCGWYGSSGGGAYVKRGGRWVLVGVVVRVTSTRNPKAMLLAVTPEDIQKFLSDFQEEDGEASEK